VPNSFFIPLARDLKFKDGTVWQQGTIVRLRYLEKRRGFIYATVTPKGHMFEDRRELLLKDILP
jgi:hypothetical protein